MRILLRQCEQGYRHAQLPAAQTQPDSRNHFRQVGDMSIYNEQIRKLPQMSPQEIVAICKSLLPAEYRHRPYHHPELKNGVGLLQSEDSMNAYMAAYGEMHIAKCRAALQNFPFDKIQGTIEIVDWGCGQGIGSLCVLDALSQRDKLQWIKRVTLIEPSSATLGRAIVNVTKATGGGISVLPLNFYLPGNDDNVLQGVDYDAQNVIHVFSNILDVAGIDLAKLARMIPRAGHQHYILCIGPLNANAYRMDSFCEIFGAQSYFSDLKNPAYARTSDTFYQYTCKTKCFVYDGSPLNLSAAKAFTSTDDLPVYSEYDPRLAVQNGVMSERLQRLYLILLNKVRLMDDDFIILQPDINGDKPDVIVLRPNKGILIINLFDEDLNECSFMLDVNENRNIKQICIAGESCVNSPLTTIQIYQENLVRLHLKDMIGKIIKDARNWSMVKKMILFTKNTQQEVDDFFRGIDKKYTYCCGMELLSDANIQSNLMSSLRLNYNNPQFDDKILKSFLRIISPKWHSYKEGKIVNLSTPQRHLVVSVADRKQKISGVAGSGKTQVLATRAVNAQIRTGKKVLILTYNKTLANYMRYRLGEIRADFPWDKIVIDYYHNFFKAQAYRLGQHLVLSSYDDETFFESVQDKTERFSAILIDETQDYMTSWLKILDKYFLEEDGEFVVFGDPKQNIYQRPLDKKGDIRLEFIGGSWNHELKERQRFANPQLANLATAFQKAFYDSDIPIDIFESTAQTSIFSRIRYQNLGRTEDISVIGDTVCKIMEDNELSPESTIILSQAGDILRDLEYHYCRWSGRQTTSTFIDYEQYQALLQKHSLSGQQNPTANYKFKNDKDAIEHNKKIHFTTATDYLKLSTIHSFKGWESPNVIFILEPESRGHDKYSISARENVPELIYTAITRARENLFIINLGNDKYHDFFNTNI